MSTFAVTGRSREDDPGDDLPFDEQSMETAMNMLAGEAERFNDDDPRQAARLMRKFTDITGMELGEGMQEALRRMEQGEDPEQIEAEMGELLEQEDPFLLAGNKKRNSAKGFRPPKRDDTLYDL